MSPPAIPLIETPLTAPAAAAMVGVPIYAFWQGIAVAGSDPRRFNGPTFSILKEIPGGMTTFGYWAIACGLIFMIGAVTTNWWLRAAGLFFLAIWSATFGVCALVAQWQTPTTGPTAGATYIFLAYLLGVLIGYRRRPGPPRDA